MTPLGPMPPATNDAHARTPPAEAARRALACIEVEGLPTWVALALAGPPEDALSGFARAGLTEAAWLLSQALGVAGDATLPPPARRARLAELEDDFLREHAHYRARLNAEC